MMYQGKARYPVKEVMLHCAAVSTGYFLNQTPFQVFSTINKWHHERGWKNGFGYHGLFMPDGEYFAGRPLDMIGAGCIGHNQGVIHYLLIESVGIAVPKDCEDGAQWLADREFTDWFKPAQRLALKRKIEWLDGIEKVSGHNDYAPKLCPGFKVQSSDWLTSRSSCAETVGGA